MLHRQAEQAKARLDNVGISCEILAWDNPSGQITYFDVIVDEQRFSAISDFNRWFKQLKPSLKTWNIYLLEEYEDDSENAPILGAVEATSRFEAVEKAGKEFDWHPTMLFAVVKEN
jgi:hypothetical protein